MAVKTLPKNKRYKFRVPPAFPRMTIGLMGGTFDPPHEGHRHISEIALKRLGIDRLWWLVTPGNPLKTRSDMASFEKRFKRARKLVSDPRIDVTGFEATRGSAYTADTLHFLLRRYPATRFIWIMGADNLTGLHNWQQWDEILHALPIAVIDRPGCRLRALSGRAAHRYQWARLDDSDSAGLKNVPPPAWTFITAPLCDISSTELRGKKKPKKKKEKKKGNAKAKK